MAFPAPLAAAGLVLLLGFAGVQQSEQLLGVGY
jgi:hypothetical protein